MSRALSAALAALLFASAAHGQSIGPNSKGGTTTPATITSTSAQILAAAAQRQLVVIDNESTTATIACAFGATAAINTAGSFTIEPNTVRVWNSAPIPTDAVNCISSAASSPATIEVN